MSTIRHRYFRLRLSGRGHTQILAANAAVKAAREQARELCMPGVPIVVSERLAGMELPPSHFPQGNAWKSTRSRGGFRGREILVFWKPNPRTVAGKKLQAAFAALGPLFRCRWAAFDTTERSDAEIELGESPDGRMQLGAPAAECFSEVWYVRVPQPDPTYAHGEVPPEPLDADEIKESDWVLAKEAHEAAKGAA